MPMSFPTHGCCRERSERARSVQVYVLLCTFFIQAEAPVHRQGIEFSGFHRSGRDIGDNPVGYPRNVIIEYGHTRTRNFPVPVIASFLLAPA